MLHDTGRALGAEHALIDGVVLVAFDIGDLTVFHVDVDTTAACAHVTGGFAHLVTDGGRKVQIGLVFGHVRAFQVSWVRNRPNAARPVSKVRQKGR